MHLSCNLLLFSGYISLSYNFRKIRDTKHKFLHLSHSISLLLNIRFRQWEPLLHHNRFHSTPTKQPNLIFKLDKTVIPELLSIPIMLTKLNPLLSKGDWCRHYVYPSSLNFNHLKMVETVRLKIIASRPPSMALLRIKYNQIYKFVQKWLGGHTDNQTDWWS